MQWKIDRITLGIQTIDHAVNPELSMKYRDKIREIMHKVDPDEKVCSLYIK